MAWSSTSITRIVCPSDMNGIPLLHRLPVDADRRPAPRAALDLQSGLDLSGPLLHDPQAEVIPGDLRHLETHSIIPDVQPHPGSRVAAQIDPHLARLGVLGDVVERLLGDTIEGHLHLGRYRA